MPYGHLADVLIVVTFGLMLLMFTAPIVVLGYFYLRDRNQMQHAILRNYPLLGRVRYLFEMVGPELRQYFYDDDSVGKPFSRTDMQSIVISGKYLGTVIGFGSKRDFEEEGYYIRNSMFPRLEAELLMDRESRIQTRRYVGHEGLFTRKEYLTEVETSPCLLAASEAVVVGPGCREPFVARGLVGMSAMSYGALGDRAVTAISEGLGIASGSWMNTGEGGLAPYHLKGGGDVVMQIGPGKFGIRDENGAISWEKLREVAGVPEVKAFELKLAQGAKIRGGHVEGAKVTPEIAAIRGVKPWTTIDSPNRFEEFDSVQGLCALIERIREEGGKPVGVKVVVGSNDSLEALAGYMASSGTGPDFITVDGGEGGSGATYQELADSVGLPLKPALLIADDTLRRRGVRDRVKVFASGKLFSADRVAIALAMGADMVNIARAFMISVGCIGAQKCHTNECPVGVATTDPGLQKALVVQEKRHRVANYVVNMRKGLFMLAAAAGLEAPTRFTREHVVYRDGNGRAVPLLETSPYPAV